MNAAQAKLRSAATLIGLAVLLLVGVTWAWSAVTKPFPEREDAATCSSSQVAEGEKVYPDQVTVSVLNAGTREGLANRTMSDLVDAGLAKGELGNAPDDAEVSGVQIWAEDLKNPAVKLVVSFLGKDAKLVRRDPTLPGVNIVVGEEFPGVTEGRKFVVAKEEVTICSPPAEEEL
ncbi:MAG TPA: LytR C-terminal domain-containing protein [Nocardioides sp.]|nr:LytR C-terminal domain-containing protein [Nocardioides sp.]